MKILRQRVPFLLGLSLVCLFAMAASAAPITGTLGFFGPGVLTFSEGGGAPGTNFIDWCPVNDGPEPAAGCGVSLGGDGDVFVTTRTGDFVGPDPSGSAGTILDMTDEPGHPVGDVYTTVTLGANNVPGFFDFADPWLYTLTRIDPQVCAPSATQVCTGYFQLNQVGTGVSVSMAGGGFITVGGDDNPFNFAITAQFDNTTIAAVIAAATTAGGIFSNSWSGQLSATPIPEPGTVAMGLLGLALVGSARVLHRRRKA